jgi:hypothetical protein
MGQLECLDPGKMEGNPDGPQTDDVKQADETEEEPGVQPALIPYPDLEQSDIEGVEDGGGKGEDVAEGGAVPRTGAAGSVKMSRQMSDE